MGKVTHFEIPADNMLRAKKFYEETFGWKMQDFSEMKYTTIQTTETDPKTNMIKEPGAINGGMFKREDSPNNLINCLTIIIDVKDIEDAIKKVKNAGGLVLKEKAEVGNIGWIAYFKDTEGNILGIWESKK